ncbi:hypothetical protein WMF45_28285 [Sorangium sp. So ce448]|uniref:hypothetical protein n=1 Tax=Sorangium sp. So ce448 TaxID=3133314 RepID=UPI003F6465B9
MSAKDSPHHDDRREDAHNEARRAREIWEQQRLRELDLVGIEEDASTFCLHCRRELLGQLARAQARGSVLFELVRREGLSPLPLHDPRSAAEGGHTPGYRRDLRETAMHKRRALWIPLACLALGALVLWVAFVLLRR